MIDELLSPGRTLTNIESFKVNNKTINFDLVKESVTKSLGMVPNSTNSIIASRPPSTPKVNCDSNFDIDKFLKQNDLPPRNKSERKKGPSLYRKMDPKQNKFENKLKKNSSNVTKGDNLENLLNSKKINIVNYKYSKKPMALPSLDSYKSSKDIYIKDDQNLLIDNKVIK